MLSVAVLLLLAASAAVDALATQACLASPCGAGAVCTPLATAPLGRTCTCPPNSGLVMASNGACIATRIPSANTAAAATTDSGKACSLCPLTYEPVVDAATGLPFFNDCIARCQLGADATLVSAAVEAQTRSASSTAAYGGAATRTSSADQEEEGASAAATMRRRQTPNFMTLLPEPAAAAKRGSKGPTVSAQTILRFADDGYVYVGRPGIVAAPKAVVRAAATTGGDTTAHDGSSRSASAPSGAGSSPSPSPSPSPVETTTKKQASATSRGTSGDGNDGDEDERPSMSMRLVYPDGDMYMKVWSAKEKKRLLQQYGSNNLDAAATSRGSRPVPSSTGNKAAAGSATAVTRSSEAFSTADGNSAAVANETTPNNSSSGASSSPPAHSSPDTSIPSTAPIRPNRRILSHATNVDIFNGESRREVTSVSYPNTAVVYISFKSDARSTSMCSGSLVGATGRMVLTAAHCIYDADSRRWYSGFTVAPGHSRNGAPYGWHGVGIVEVWTSWQNEMDFSYDIGLMQLQYHVTSPGSFGYTTSPPCSYQTYSLTSSGYPADRPHGSLWTQSARASTNLCYADADTNFQFDSAGGQSGSAFWTSDNTARMVLSYSTSTTGGAIAINPTFGSWMNDFSNKYISTTPLRIVVGGSRSDLFISCSTNTWRCVGTNSRSAATRFYAYPIGAANKFALQVPGTTLCLNLWGGGNRGDVNLYTCNTARNWRFGSGDTWYVGGSAAAGGISVVRSNSGGSVWWDGSGRQMLAVSACWWAWQCTWGLQAP